MGDIRDRQVDYSLNDKGVYIGEIGKGVCNLEFVTVSKRRHIHHKTDITEVSETTLRFDNLLEKPTESSYVHSYDKGIIIKIS